MEIVEVGPRERGRLLTINKGDDYHPLSERWLNLIISKGERFFVAKENGKDVGFVAIDTNFKYDKNGIEMDVISVKKETQRKGVGNFLLNKIMEITKEEDKKFIYIFVSESNSRAISFYKKNGFYECGILKDRYGEGKHSLIMKTAVKR